MNKLIALYCLTGFLVTITSAPAQTNGFGDRPVELRTLSSVELDKPSIPDDAIADAAPGTPGPIIVPRPLYLVYRYYSPSP